MVRGSRSPTARTSMTPRAGSWASREIIHGPRPGCHPANAEIASRVRRAGDTSRKGRSANDRLLAGAPSRTGDPHRHLHAPRQPDLLARCRRCRQRHTSIAALSCGACAPARSRGRARGEGRVGTRAGGGASGSRSRSSRCMAAMPSGPHRVAMPRRRLRQSLGGVVDDDIDPAT